MALALFALLAVVSSGAASAQNETSEVRKKSDPEAPSSGQLEEFSGTIDIVWSDPPLGSNIEPEVEYFLNDDQGNKTELSSPDGGDPPLPVSDPLELKGKQVTVRGTGEPGDQIEVQAVEPEGSQRTASDASAASTGLTGSQPTATILCRFGDSTSITPKPKSFFETLMGNSYPGMDHYWREASYNNINLTGSQVFGWYNMPRPKSYYHNSDSTADTIKLADDCTAAANADVTFTDFENINLVFNQQWDDPKTSKGGWAEAILEGQRKTWGFTWLPPVESSNGTPFYIQDIWAHEMGHSFGLPHSLGYGHEYGNNWDLMSGGSACRDVTPDYVCNGQHTISYNKDRRGWIPSSRKYTAIQGPNQNVTIERLALPPSTGHLMAQVPINGSSNQFYTVEARRFAGYDNEAPSEAVVIHKIDRLKGLGNEIVGQIVAEVVDGDNNGDANDAGSAWVPGETFTDSDNGISIAVTGQTTTGYNVRISTPTTVPSDTTPPEVELVPYPQDPVIANGEFPFAAYAMDERGPVDHVEFLVDGEVVGTGEALDSEGEAFTYYWDSTTITDGRSTVTARAYDATGNTNDSAGQEFIVDNFYPETTISGGPGEGSTGGTSATFEFSSDDRDGAFQCKLDNGPYEECSSPKTYSGLTSGQHTFRVYTVGSADEEVDDVDDTPAVRNWTVAATSDTTRPTGSVKINNGAKKTTKPKVKLTLSATDNAGGSGVSQMCISNTKTCSTWQPYASSKKWTLAGGAGTKTVYVRYKDGAGNVSALYKDTIKYAP